MAPTEEGLTDLEESVSKMVKKAMERAMDAMRHSLAEWAKESQTKAAEKMGLQLCKTVNNREMEKFATIWASEKAMERRTTKAKKMGAESDALSGRLEGRSMDHEGAIINPEPSFLDINFPHSYQFPEYTPPPTAPHLFHMAEPPPPPSSPYMSTPPVTLTCHTTISSGQPFYALASSDKHECHEMLQIRAADVVIRDDSKLVEEAVVVQREVGVGTEGAQVFDKSPSRESTVKSQAPSPIIGNVSTPLSSATSVSHELLSFDGTNPRGWILQVGKYINGSDAEKIALAGSYISGKARAWYHLFYETSKEDVTWKKVLHDLLIRFDNYDLDSPCYLINPLGIQQHSSVGAYEMTLQIKEISEFVYEFVFTEQMLVHNFVTGLRKDIRERVSSLSPTTLLGAINLAKFQELQLEDELLFVAAKEGNEMSDYKAFVVAASSMVSANSHEVFPAGDENSKADGDVGSNKEPEQIFGDNVPAIPDRDEDDYAVNGIAGILEDVFETGSSLHELAEIGNTTLIENGVLKSENGLKELKPQVQTESATLDKLASSSTVESKHLVSAKLLLLSIPMPVPIVFDESWERGFVFLKMMGSVYNLRGNEVVGVNELFGEMCRAEKQIVVGEVPSLILRMAERVEAFVDMEEQSFTIPVCVTDPLKRIARIIIVRSSLNGMQLLRQPRAVTIADGLDKWYVTAGNKNTHAFDPGGATIDVTLSTTQKGIFELVSKIYIMSIIPADEMLNRDVIIRNLMTYGFWNSSDTELGWQYFREMTEWPVFSVNSLPSGLATEWGAFMQVKQPLLDHFPAFNISNLLIFGVYTVGRHVIVWCRNNSVLVFDPGGWTNEELREKLMKLKTMYGFGIKALDDIAGDLEENSKSTVGQVPISPNIPEQLSPELKMPVEPEVLLDVRQVQMGSEHRLEALLKWKNLPLFEATWEEVESTHVRFSLFHLEDKVNLWGRGIAMNQPGP